MPFEFLESEQFACGRSAGGRAASTAPAARDHRPFAFPGTEARWARDRQADVRHVRLEIALDFERRRIAGTVTHTFVPILDGLSSLEFDAVDLRVAQVRIAGGRRLRFEVADDKLRVRFPRPLPAGRAVSVSIRYAGSPQRGLYFCGPDEHYPGRRTEAWTQGQDEDARYWFPCYDYPNQKATTEVLATVPARMMALSNGALVRRRVDRGRGTATWHWRQSIPHVAYLVTLVAGEYETALEARWRRVPIRVYAPPGRAADARRSCGKTRRMMAFFSRVTGVPYPYEKYDQVFVQDFIFGGMENTTATTLTDTALLDRRAARDNSSDGLVAHELAHQWWGDLVTCRDWSHGWLNEGFATFFEALWKEHDLGVDEYRYYLLQMRDSYLGEDGGRYRRPIVCRTYRDPVEVFDRHLYEKGALVLHMLRCVLGDDLFWRSLRRYLRTHARGNVETDDLRRAVEAETGRNLEPFFDQWLYRAGHPELKASFSWDEKTRTATVTVNQAQDTSADGTPLFRTPLALSFATGGGREVVRRVELSGKDHSWHVPLPRRPRFVRLDPGWTVLKTLEFSPPRDMLVAQLAEDEDVTGRCHAAAALGKDGSPAAVAALRRSLASRAFWGVRADAAKALGRARSAPARDALLGRLGEAHPKVRRAVVAALGEWREDARVARVLAARLEAGDPSVLVEAELARAVGRVRGPGAYDLLSRLYRERDSWNDVVRAGCLAGLAELRDARAVGEARDAARLGRPNALRGAGVAALGKLQDAKDAPRSDIADEMARFVGDWWLRVKMVACTALGEMREERGLPALARAAERDSDGRVRRAAREALKRVREGRDRGEDVRALRDELEKLRDEVRKVRDEVAKQRPKA